MVHFQNKTLSALLDAKAQFQSDKTDVELAHSLVDSSKDILALTLDKKVRSVLYISCTPSSHRIRSARSTRYAGRLHSDRSFHIPRNVRLLGSRLLQGHAAAAGEGSRYPHSRHRVCPRDRLVRRGYHEEWVRLR